MCTLLESYSEHCKEQEKNLPFSFNVLDEQCGHIVENSHTNVLMKILQYKNQYGYVFLEKFFDMSLGIQAENIIDKTKDIIFDRERFYEEGRIDGFIYQKNQFALIIENKVNGATNQANQLEKYITSILEDTNVFPQTGNDLNKEKIWVCFLTKDGREKPDADSQVYMRRMGICTQICDNDGNGVVEGPHYAAINYMDHILPWLKEEVQPIVLQRDQILNAGILQYIDFLEGMFGLRQADTELLRRSKDWLNQNYPTLFKGSFIQKNSNLDKISKQIAEELKKKLENTKKSDNSDLRRYAGLLNKLIIDINDEPMKAFFDYTRQYFESNGLMKQCVISHIFNYYYIQIRETSWPRCIHFEWYALGISKLTNKNPKNLKLYLHIENPNYIEAFKQEKDFFAEKGFSLEKDNNDLLTYYTKDYKPQKGILNMDNNELKDFLYDAYGLITKDMIERIEDAIASVNNK